MEKVKRNPAQGKIRKNGMKIYFVPLMDLGITLWISYFLIRSYFGLVFFIPILIFHLKLFHKKELEEKNNEFDVRFKEMLSALSSALRAGHSLENAFKDAENNLSLLYGKSDTFVRELSMMNRKVDMHIPIEEVFNEFSRRHPFEEVVMMSDILGFAKRLGGNYIENIQRTLEKINESLSLKEEIKAMTSEKRLELKMMLIMPPGIVTYIALTSPEFLSAIYGTILGFGVVMVCVSLFILAMVLGERIIRIEV